MQTAHFPIRVYWEDTDAGGIVYHANYLRFMERARSDLLRQIGFGQDAQRGREDGILFVVASTELTYHRGAKLDDDLTVNTRVTKLGRASLIFEQIITRGEERITSANVRVGVVNAVTMAPARMPADVYEKIQTFAA